MSFRPRPQPPGSRIINLSSSDSENNDSMEASQLMPNEVKKGSYGMFSRAGIPDYSPKIFGSTAPSRQQPPPKDGLRLKLRPRNVQREESPLFEPERGIRIDSDDSVGDENEEVLLISPSVSAPPKRRAKAKQVKRQRTHSSTARQHRDNRVDTATPRDPESDSAMEISTSITEEIPQHDKTNTTTFHALSLIYSASPLPGSIAPLPEYRNIIAQIDQQYNVRAEYNAKLLSYEIEDKQLEKAIADLPAKEETRKQTIRESYAAGIQKDMGTRFQSDEELHSALEKRRVEAEKAREKLADALRNKQSAAELARVTVAQKKRETQAQLTQLEKDLLPMMEQKSQLEERGGAAMIFALCEQIVNE